MFLERQELDMCESVFDGIVSKQRRHFAVGQGTIVLCGNSPPGTEMNFVDRKRLAPRASFLTPGHPRAIMKLVIGLECNRRSVGRNLHHKRVRIGFEKRAPSVFDFVLVQFTRRHAGDEKFPHARTSEQTHPMRRAIPFIEVANDGYAFGIRRPDCEGDAAPAFVSNQMRAELFIDAFVSAFTKEMQVEFAEHGRKFV